MIPKIIHYCWFGGKQQGELVRCCIASWKQFCPEYTFIEWTEENFDVTSHPFTARMYKEKKFAFVADYVRLIALLKHGGVYLDTDMLLLQSLNTLLNTSLLLGKEDTRYISCGMIGSTPQHPFIEAMRREYDSMKVLRPNPVIMTELFKKLTPSNTVVLPSQAFYPFSSYTIRNYKGEDLGEDVYGVHLWNYSWGHPLNKFFKKIGIHRLGKRIAETLGIKKMLKKLLGFY